MTYFCPATKVGKRAFFFLVAVFAIRAISREFSYHSWFALVLRYVISLWTLLLVGSIARPTLHADLIMAKVFTDFLASIRQCVLAVLDYFLLMITLSFCLEIEN